MLSIDSEAIQALAPPGSLPATAETL